MSIDGGGEALVILNVSPELEEALIDWLLEREDGSGFTSFPVQGHSTRHEGLSIAEQVSGRQRRHQFQVELAAGRVDEFLEALEGALGGAGIHYWVMPLVRSGRFGAA